MSTRRTLLLACTLVAAACDGGETTPPPPADAGAPDAARAPGDAATTPPPDLTLPTSDAVTPGGPSHPFGAHRFSYAPGTILPARPQRELDDATSAFYDRWKQRFLASGCGAGRYYVDFGDSSILSVSEGHGYGMLIAALMAGHDPDAQRDFDGLYQFYMDHRSGHDPGSYLMGWAQGQDCRPTQGNDSATDGDLDIAFALLLADAQWGSAGAVDYATAAQRIIGDILRYEVNPTTSYTRLGDWATAGDAQYYWGTRPSDFMLDHFRAYQKTTGDARWGQVTEALHGLVATLQTGHAAQTGLLPDFVVASNTTPRPAGPGYLEDQTDGDYSWNACRVPWHLGTDWVVSGDARARAALGRINPWIRGRTGGDPSRIHAGYKLDGTDIGGGDNSMAFVAPFGVGAMADAQDQAWLDAIWGLVAGRALAGNYYEDTIKLLCMIVMSGNWWTP